MTWKQIFRFFYKLFYYFSAGNHPYISDPFVDGFCEDDYGDDFSEKEE